MNIGKYDIPAGSGSAASSGSTAVAGNGGGSTVDLTPITEKIAALESKVSQLELQLSKMQTIVSGLDSKYLSKFGDRSDYTYALGAVYSDFIQNEMFGNGVGYRISGNATAAVDDKYDLTIKDVGWAMVAFNTIQQSDASMVDSNVDEATAQLNAMGISIGETLADGYLLIDCGATLTSERCFTTIAKRVEYQVRRTVGQQIYVSGYMEADTDSNGNFILYFRKADNISFDIRFRYTYSFHEFGNITSGTYRLYIQGTDPGNNRTDCFAAAAKTAKLSASGLTVIEGDNGARLTCNGVQRTTDGGTTWN